MNSNIPSRRSFLRLAASSSLVPFSAPLILGCATHTPTWWKTEPGVFQHGVASGDPLCDRVILWTRVSSGHPSTHISWQVALDEDFASIVSEGQGLVTADTDYTFQVDATGLQAGTSYFYRFLALGHTSMTGRTRTLPHGHVEELRLAATSCSNFPAGYFHVYDEIASEDVDVVIHLGDYLYEYDRNGYATQGAEERGRVPEPSHELLDLSDYRARHAQYRTDRALQGCHARHPFIVVWDDHEVANDSYNRGAKNHDDSEGSFDSRKAAAQRAWFEWMPVRKCEGGTSRIYREFVFGDLAHLLMLDTRHEARDKPLEIDAFRVAGLMDVARLKRETEDASRSMLGEEQHVWLCNAIATSSSTWQVLGQQVLMGRYHLPVEMVTSIGRNASRDPTYGVTVGRQVLAAKEKSESERTPEEQALLLDFIPQNLDAWDGYSAERDDILKCIHVAGKRLVALAGDTHNAWACQLTTAQGEPVGAEFGAASVTSPGYERELGSQRARELGALMTGLIDDLAWANLNHRGFVMIHLTHEAVTADFGFVSNVQTIAYERVEPERVVLKDDLSIELRTT